MSHPSRFTRSTLERLIVGLLLEFGPIFIFLAAFGHFHIYKATMLLMIGTIFSTVLTYRLQKRLPYLALYVAFITIAFGYLTLLHREPKFIQMRDTLYDMTMAITLLFGLMINVSFIKIAFHEVIPMKICAWHRLTYAWIGFFLAVAAMNEAVRRYYSLQEWFAFKGIMVLITIVFGITTLYFFYERENEKELLDERA
jgi:intracellular septation protein